MLLVSKLQERLASTLDALNFILYLFILLLLHFLAFLLWTYYYHYLSSSTVCLITRHADLFSSIHRSSIGIPPCSSSTVAFTKKVLLPFSYNLHSFIFPLHSTKSIPCFTISNLHYFRMTKKSSMQWSGSNAYYNNITYITCINTNRCVMARYK